MLALYYLQYNVCICGKMMYKVYKVLCLYEISGVLSIEAMVEVRVRVRIGLLPKSFLQMRFKSTINTLNAVGHYSGRAHTPA